MGKYDTLREVYAGQKKALDVRKKEDKAPAYFVIVIAIVASVFLTPIGGFVVYFILKRAAVAGVEAANTGGESWDFETKGPQAERLISAGRGNLVVLRGKELEKRTDAARWLRRLLESRQKDLQDLIADGFAESGVETQAGKIGTALEELADLESALREAAASEEQRHEQEAQAAAEQAKVDAANAKSMAQVEAEKANVRAKVEKAFRAGAMSKADYQKRMRELS